MVKMRRVRGREAVRKAVHPRLADRDWPQIGGDESIVLLDFGVGSERIARVRDAKRALERADLHPGEKAVGVSYYFTNDARNYLLERGCEVVAVSENFSPPETDAPQQRRRGV